MKVGIEGSSSNHWGGQAYVCDQLAALYGQHPGGHVVFGPNREWFEAHLSAYHSKPGERSVLRAQYESVAQFGDDQPESSRMVGGTAYLSVAEYLRTHLSSKYYPSVRSLRRTGTDRTYSVLGKMAAAEGLQQGVSPVKLRHPEYGSVNGWPVKVLQAALDKFMTQYDVEWMKRDPVLEGRAAAVRDHRDDEQWQKLAVRLDETTEDRDETPEQRLLRRQSVSAAMFAIEKEYESR